SSAPPPEKNEALEAQQQMSLFQNCIREQNAHLEMLREKAHDLEVQLESSQKNAKDKENTFAQMEENMEDTIQQLCESTEEKEQDVKSLQDLVASERLSVLQCALSVRDSEIRELKNEIKDICRQLENLRAEAEFDAMWNEPHQLTGEDELVHEELEFQYGFGVGSSRDPLAEIKNSEVT
uniref:Uncharacterized protein n=1 Tax=Melopsittacus undulatus TaxID=13146 RepID=A0A8V5GVW3_MELUD